MWVELELKNYRCFSDSNPARIPFGPGFTSLVGINNAGKSTLLKFFYEFRPLFWALHQANYLGPALQQQPMGLAHDLPVLDTDDLFNDTNQRDIEIRFRLPSVVDHRQQSGWHVGEQLVVTFYRDSRTWTAKLDHAAVDAALTSSNTSFNGTLLQSRNGSVLGDFSYLFDVFKDLEQALYIGPFRNAINIGTNQRYFDIQVGQSVIQSWRSWKSGPRKRENEAAIELTENIRRIFGFDSLEINPSSDDQSLQVSVNRKSYKLADLGSGFTQFFLVFANAAIRRPSYILIDEPELNLHPSLQLDFLTSLASYASKGVLFSTHNVGLARASADKVYSVRRGNEEVREVEKYEEAAIVRVPGRVELFWL